MSQKKIKYLHLFIWLFAIFANLPYSNFSSDMPPEQIVTWVFAFLYLMMVFYSFYLVLAPKFLMRKKIAEFFGISFLFVLIMPFFGYTILFLIRALFEDSFSNFYSGYSVSTHMSGYFPVLTAAVFGSFFSVIINWFTTMNQKAELDKQKLAAELDLLKSKLNPHFLFNTLNNIDSLIHQDAGEASAALIRLSDMMRYLTYETSSDTIELDREVDYIQNFIELNRIRIKAADDIEFRVQGDLMVKIAPALFIPLIENAFKFAGYRHQKPSVSINLLSENGIVTLEISNNCDNTMETTESSHSGFGLINLKKRLEIIYPGKHSFIIERGESVFRVKLEINTNADQLYSN
jgi:two-component system, LytTR family, sensor kinase